MLSHNASYEDLQLAFQHSSSTFHDYINEFFDIIPVLETHIVRSRYIDEPHPKILWTAASFRTARLNPFFDTLKSSSLI
jgi:hypothetical protein